MKAAKPDPPEWVFDDLEHNGWEWSYPHDRAKVSVKVQHAMLDLHLPLENTKSFDMQVDLENEFDNIHGISTVRHEFKDYCPSTRVACVGIDRIAGHRSTTSFLSLQGCGSLLLTG